MPAVNVDQMRRKASQALSGFSTGQKVVTGLAVAALIAGGMMFSSWANKPTYVPLFSNLQPSDASAITGKLNGAKVPYKLSDGGGTILVPQNQVYQQRLDLSANGLPSGGSQGYSLLDKQGITTSEFRQRVDYQRAMEGELAKTVGSIDGVAAATVHLVIPAQDVFAGDTSKPSASVLIQNVPGKSTSPGQVQAIVHLVSSSVESLDPDSVTVADAKGNVLSAPGSGGLAAAGDARSSQTAIYEDTVAKSLQDMLATVIGPGHAVVRVTADLDFDQRSTTTEAYANDKQAPALTESTNKETYTGTGNPPAAGTLGTTGAAAGAAGTNSNYVKDGADRTFAVGKVTSEVKQAPGAVKRLSIAVALDTAAKGADQATVEKLVSAAAGISAARGDIVAVNTIAFDQTRAKEAKKELSKVAAAKSQQGLMSMVKTIVALLMVALVLFFVARSSKRNQRRVPIIIPADMAELEAPRMPIEATTVGRDRELVSVGAAASGTHSAVPTNELSHAAVGQSDIVNLIERQPEEVAQLLRNWLADRRS